MHILIIPSWYPNQKNPFNGNFIEKQVEVISQLHEVSIINIENFQSSSVEIIKNSKNTFTVYNVYIPENYSKVKKFFSVKKAVKKILNEINDVDIVHNFILLNKGFLALWIKNRLNIPLIITEHASYLLRENYQKLNLIEKFKIAYLLKKANRVSVVSNLLKDELNYLFKLKNIYLTPNVINRDLFNIGENHEFETLKFIHISTLDPLKNVNLILDGFEEFYLVTKLNFELTIIAEIENKEIVTQIEKLKIKDKVNLIGPLSESEVAIQLKKSQALILLSAYETFSCVIAEAWSCGIPVISTNVGIAKNMIPEAGILINSPEKEKFVLALKEFSRRKMEFNREKIRSLSENFGKEQTKKAFENLYNSLK